MHIKMRISSRFGEEKKILKRIDEELARYNFLSADVEEFKSALAEVCINAIEHGNLEGQEKQVEVKLRLHGNILHGVVIDEGKGFELEKGTNGERGFGLIIVHQFVDHWTMFCDRESRRFCFALEKVLRMGK